jgi:hypothetical protein
LFLVDGEPVATETAPTISRLAMSYWAFSFWVWPDGNAIQGQIDWVATRGEGAGSP